MPILNRVNHSIKIISDTVLCHLLDYVCNYLASTKVYQTNCLNDCVSSFVKIISCSGGSCEGNRYVKKTKQGVHLIWKTCKVIEIRDFFFFT